MRDRLKEATSSAILAAAEQAVTELGIENARIDEIARRAGVAVGTVYNYFADRDALLTALRDARKRELIAVLDEALEAGKGQPFRAQLVGFLGALLGYYEKHRQFFVVLIAAESERGKIAGPSKETAKEIYARAEKLSRAGVREGVLRAEHAELYPGFLFAAVRTAAMVELHRKQSQPMTALIEPLAHLFLFGAAGKGK